MKPAVAARPVDGSKADEFDAIKRRIHNKLVDKLDLTKVGELEGEVLRREIRMVVEHLCDSEETFLNRNPAHQHGRECKQTKHPAKPAVVRASVKDFDHQVNQADNHQHDENGANYP